MKTHVLLALMAFGCSPVMAEDRSASWPLDIEGPAVYEYVITEEISPYPSPSFWATGLGEKDADGNESLDSVEPPASFEYVEDLGEHEEEHVLAASGKNITATYNDYLGIYTFD